MIYGHLRPRRNLMTADQHRQTRDNAFRIWRRETCARWKHEVMRAQSRLRLAQYQST